MINKFLLSVSVIVFALSVTTAPVFAQTTDTTQTIAERLAELLQQIKTLQEQLLDLEAQQQSLRGEIREAVQITRQLAIGATGDDVRELQELLASDPELYPEGIITGYFGSLTARAIERLQERFGIERAGEVGPLTRQTINQLLSRFAHGQKNVFERISDDEDEDDVDRTALAPGVKGVKVCHKTGTGQHTISIGGPAVQAHLAHGDTLGRCDDEVKGDDDDEDEDEDDDEDVTDLMISDVSARRITESGATITWETNEDADSTVWFATSSGFVIGAAGVQMKTSSSEVEKHQIRLADLNPGTTYYFRVGSEDASGNDAMSSEFSFTTLADTEAPEISDLEVKDIATTTATIVWETDEAANSVVWYSTTSNFNTDADGVLRAESTLLTTSHSINLSGLTASTTYYYMVSSTDSDNNETKSDEESFKTLGQ
ncbi:hypothetical protein A3C89_01935 [Candidatus Kaiserbacteria bacterium RIFCSPHIGHO2_02_FULL_50_50]|uniref:Fibronectin type-III domain-containing protein n=1 Tax=Candidatus Kaiserbacteria bacterium RIFCSPHIGHO2_02_FULL_50_50 TaxID=1798492 RepID=A0A1F6DCV1_9BACT|nr:MAG: hypothetical protein A3C89_01935 [Candidatus Kaiserbacteria bacterium RIFCSPHIGHO2_02_FULL_50_50]OGG89031.1 MAG: hypothetical protein A3G62_04335 [Candidatus Kaiserbacteria bacterium RIFCSPLOWO2_12_FULL_50_10]